MIANNEEQLITPLIPNVIYFSQEKKNEMILVRFQEIKLLKSRNFEIR